MRTLTRALMTALKWICVVLFAALVIVVVWQVFARLVLGRPQAWTDEASRMIFVWLGLFAAAFLFGERGHIAVDFIATRLGGATKAVSLFVQVAIIFFAATLMVYGGIRASGGASNQRLSALDFLTLGQMYYVLPVAGVIIIIFAIEHIINIASGAEPPFPASEEEQLLDEMAAEGALPVGPDSPDAPGSTRAPKEA
ncbi:TRAP transporter small permease [Propioniciclava sp. MC1683]|uniref:TRAP transporter small permease n=1 Tax=Propioniciclava sp. MC1683 TaxID=2760309 RepID=UPI0016044163|nr:TRAP transporter small permease [Propioniciclava sp. MC1683]MBB1502103.1 TRAP transporter small permease [Propioniciclava sp. MC1683]